MCIGRHRKSCDIGMPCFNGSHIAYVRAPRCASAYTQTDLAKASWGDRETSVVRLDTSTFGFDY